MKNDESDQVFEAELKRRFVKDFLDLLVLQMVKNRPAWGYKIIKETEKRCGVKLRHGALYPMLNTLETKGLLVSRKELEKGRIRKTYRITSQGKRLLQIYHDFLEEQTSEKKVANLEN